MKYGRYEIVAELGRGSMGVVYKAHDPQIDRAIALKVLREDRVTSDDFVRRFLKEAMAAGRLSHPGIVTVFDVGQDRNSIYIAMEFLQGTPLNELMAERNFTYEEIVDIGIQTARALEYAHQHGIIHRDIKPPNIIYSPEGAIRVTDFGIARIEDPNGQQMTQVGEILGTPLYMSPEQLMGQPLDGRSDIYSLGIILYQLTTGKRPYQGTTLAALFKTITQDIPVPPHSLDQKIPEKLSRAIMKLLEKDPADRFASGKELIEALETCLPGQVISPIATSPSLQSTQTGGKYAGKPLIAGVVGLILFAGLVAYYLFRPQPYQQGKQVIAESSDVHPAVTHPDRMDPNEILRQATSLSIIVNDLPKKELVLKSAMELVKVSPRYQEDVEIAEKTYNNVRDTQDKKLDVYLNNIRVLNNTYPVDELADAMEKLTKDTLSERQKNAVSLIEQHLKLLHNGATLSKEQVLADFSQRFKNFLD